MYYDYQTKKKKNQYRAKASIKDLGGNQMCTMTSGIGQKVQTTQNNRLDSALDKKTQKTIFATKSKFGWLKIFLRTLRFCNTCVTLLTSNRTNE